MATTVLETVKQIIVQLVEFGHGKLRLQFLRALVIRFPNDRLSLDNGLQRREVSFHATSYAG